MKTAPLLALAGCLLLAAGCKHPSTAAAGSGPAPAPIADAATPPANAGVVRATGMIQAVRAYAIQVPQIRSTSGRLTLVKLLPTGTKVKEGDVLAEFDRVGQEDAALDAQAKYEDLGHQVKQTEAQNRSEAAKRLQQLKQAEADLRKAELELQKGPTLSEIERLQNEARAETAKAQVQSLQKTNKLRDTAAAAGLRRLQLQMDRQLVTLERTRKNLERLVVHAPIAGMVTLENTFRGNSMSTPQEGDQLYPGMPMLKIFDPAEMEVVAAVGEPEGAVLTPGRKATVRLDAYPDVIFPASLISANPVATQAPSSPIKNFTARFRIERMDPRLMPDLSVVVLIQREDARRPEGAKRREDAKP